MVVAVCESCIVFFLLKYCNREKKCHDGAVVDDALIYNNGDRTGEKIVNQFNKTKWLHLPRGEISKMEHATFACNVEIVIVVVTKMYTNQK